MMRHHELPTSLGPPLVASDAGWLLDVATLPVLHGLSVLSRALAEMVAHARAERLDAAIERRLRARENPELIERFGIDLVRLAAESTTLDAIAAQGERFEGRLRALLGSLQRQRYRELLLPLSGQTSHALVAEFGSGADHQRFVLEHVSSRRDPGRGALRITVECQGGMRLDLGAIPHVRIDDVEDRHFIAGSTRIAQTWAESLRREAERGRRSFFEQRSAHSHLFRQLDQAGLASLQRVALQWGDAAVPFLLENAPDEVATVLKRVLLTLEDRGVRELLGRRETVCVDAGGLRVFLDVAQLGRVLVLSLGQRRERADTDAFLQRMPALSAVTASHAATAPLRGVRVFLVHHMTSEVVGLIAALRALGCTDLTCLFVAYAGEPPASYLDAILDLPADEFRALALVHVPDRDRVEGHYRLSTMYSRLDEAPAIDEALHGRAAHYLEAMRAAAVVTFLQQVRRAEAAGDRVLLVEDGGYLGPVLNAAMLENATVQQFAQGLGHACADARPLASAVGSLLLATVEHTRNGFDRIAEVERRHGRLALPCFSIAISRRKRLVESREVAASVLGAVETILNAAGLVLARRKCLVLGSRGAIGGELCRALGARLVDPTGGLFGLDRVVGGTRERGFAEAGVLAELPPEAWLDVDLVLGVTGASVLQGADVERWLAHGQKDVLVLASGSTKKVEFEDVARWFEGLLRSDDPRVAGAPVEVGVEELLDPRTARVYGHRWSFCWRDGSRRAAIWALGNLTPINFLFYGVATELIDEVLAELASVSLGAVRRARRGESELRLLAVDRDVDANAEPLVPSPRR